MTQQTNGTPELKYSEENFRDMYEACKGVLDWWQREYDGFLPDAIANTLKAVDKVEGK